MNRNSPMSKSYSRRDQDPYLGRNRRREKSRSSLHRSCSKDRSQYYHSRDWERHHHQRESRTSPTWEGRIVSWPSSLLMRSVWIFSTDLVPPTRTSTPLLMTGTHSRTPSSSGGGPIRTHNLCPVSLDAAGTPLFHRLRLLLP